MMHQDNRSLHLYMVKGPMQCHCIYLGFWKPREPDDHSDGIPASRYVQIPQHFLKSEPDGMKASVLGEFERQSSRSIAELDQQKYNGLRGQAEVQEILEPFCFIFGWKPYLKGPSG